LSCRKTRSNIILKRISLYIAIPSYVDSGSKFIIVYSSRLGFDCFGSNRGRVLGLYNVNQSKHCIVMASVCSEVKRSSIGEGRHASNVALASNWFFDSKILYLGNVAVPSSFVQRNVVFLGIREISGNFLTF
jgi:hypothetical protein